MSSPRIIPALVAVAISVVVANAAEPDVPLPAATDVASESTWSWHVQSTGIAQAHPSFPAPCEGPNSMDSRGEIKETVSFDLYLGVALWHGAELHADALTWQGFGLSNAVGAEAFPNGEAFRLGTNRPDANLVRLFVRQTFGFGGGDEEVADDPLHLGGRRPVSRLTFTLGRFSPKDVFDQNAYANDARTQFLNWALGGNEAWDYPADSLGYETGLAVEWTAPGWAVRSGVFQMPREANAMPVDPHLTQAWGAVLEMERRFRWRNHPGAVRLLGYDNRAHMGSYVAALAAARRPANVVATRAYRGKGGAGVNLEQELTDGVGFFARVGWSDGRNEAWTFADVDRTATAGFAFAGKRWGRDDDTLGIAGALNGIGGVHRRYFEAGGTGILAGDGRLRYGTERTVEAYYDAQIVRGLSAAADVQLITNPAYNRDRGPIPVFAVRLHAGY